MTVIAHDGEARDGAKVEMLCGFYHTQRDSLELISATPVVVTLEDGATVEPEVTVLRRGLAGPKGTFVQASVKTGGRRSFAAWAAIAELVLQDNSVDGGGKKHAVFLNFMHCTDAAEDFVGQRDRLLAFVKENPVDEEGRRLPPVKP